MKTDKSPAGKLPAISEKQSLKQIRKLHGEVFEAMRTSLPKAIHIGELLAGIKAKIERGQWLPWIEKNLPFSERSAQNYIRCFDEKDRLLSATDADLPLSVSGALALLSAPKSEPKPAPAPASRFAELHGKVMHSMDCIDEVLPCLNQPDVDGETIVTEPEFQSFIREQGIQLAESDFIGLCVIGRAFEKGVTVTAGAIIDTLKHFNPSRTQEATA